MYFWCGRLWVWLVFLKIEMCFFFSENIENDLTE